jgi:hypothetical protein
MWKPLTMRRQIFRIVLSTVAALMILHSGAKMWRRSRYCVGSYCCTACKVVSVPP